MINNFPALVRAKEDREGRVIDATAVYKESGVAYTTARRWLEGRVTTFRSDTVQALCNWLPCTLAELIEYTPENGG